MLGQTVLCPNCLERVYVTDASKPQASTTTASGDAADQPLRPFAAATIAAAAQANKNQPRPLPIGLIAGVGGAVALLLVGGFVMWGLKPAQHATPETSRPAAASIPPPPPTVAEVQRPEPAKAKSPTAPTTLAEAARARAQDAPTERPPTSPASTATSAAPSPMTLAGIAAAAGSASSRAPAAASHTTSPNSMEVWRLPALDSSGPEVLASLGDTEAAWKIAVRSAMADPRMGSNVVLEPDSDPGAWTLKYVSNVPAAGNKEPLAVLRRSGPELTLAWATPLTDPQMRRELANCLLEISANTVKRVGQLREPLRLEPIALDLTAEKQTIEAQIEDSPRVDGLRLEIVELSGFSGEAKLRNGLKTVTAGSALPSAPLSLGMMSLTAGPLVIEFAEIPGLEIRVRFAGVDAAGKLAIAIEPAFRENQAAEIDLRNSRKLDLLESEARKPLPEALRELPAAEKGLSRWQAEDKEHKAKEPPKTDRRFLPWQNKDREIKQWVNKFENEAKRYRQTIDTCQARLDVLTKLRDLMKSSADKPALIRYIVYSECGQPDLLLVDGRGQH